MRARVQINATQFPIANILFVGLGNVGVLIDLLAMVREQRNPQVYADLSI